MTFLPFRLWRFYEMLLLTLIRRLPRFVCVRRNPFMSPISSAIAPFKAVSAHFTRTTASARHGSGFDAISPQFSKNRTLTSYRRIFHENPKNFNVDFFEIHFFKTRFFRNSQKENFFLSKNFLSHPFRVRAVHLSNVCLQLIHVVVAGGERCYHNSSSPPNSYGSMQLS